jgi:phage tail protein X
MYYNKNSNINSDYYSAYGYSDKNRDNQNRLNMIIKILVIILLLTFIIFGYLFFLKKDTSNQRVPEDHFSTPKIVTETTPNETIFSPQRDETSNSLSNQEILKIVKIVIQQMQEQSHEDKIAPIPSIEMSGDDAYAKALMREEMDSFEREIESVDISDIKSKKIATKSTPLEKSNHYNKVVIERENPSELDALVQLTKELREEESAKAEIATQSNYTKSISKELSVRSNEMRIIVVKRGDTLSSIAFRAYGDYNAYSKIFEANPEIIKNPNLIFVGQRLRVPL